GLEAADARPVPGSRIDDDEGPLLRVDRDPGRWDDSGQPVIDRARKLPAVHHQLPLEAQDVRRLLRHVLEILIAGLAQHIPEQQGTLRRIDNVLGGATPQSVRRQGPRTGRRIARRGSADLAACCGRGLRELTSCGLCHLTNLRLAMREAVTAAALSL